MAEDYINLNDPRSQSLAEVSLIEQLQAIARQVDEALREARLLIDNYLEGRLEVVKTKYDRVEMLKNKCEELKSKAIEYLVRVTPSLLNKDIYRTIIIALSKISQDIDSATYRTKILASKNKVLDTDTTKMVKEILEEFSKQYNKLLDTIRILGINPANAAKTADEVLKIEETIDKLYREASLMLYENLENDIPVLLITKEFVDLIESASDLVRDIAENIKYLALHKV